MSASDADAPDARAGRAAKQASSRTGSAKKTTTKTSAKRAAAKRTTAKKASAKKAATTAAKPSGRRKKVAARTTDLGMPPRADAAARTPIRTVDDALARTAHWYAARDWTLFDFQREAWAAWHAGESGLIHSPTGSGKTLAAWLGPVQDALARGTPTKGLEVLWITPLRALATDTCRSLEAAVDALADPGDPVLRVDLRTGDTPSHRRARQRSEPPFALITTPESLSVILSSEHARVALAEVRTIVVDEWHELMGSKRGVMLQLGLARVRAMRPDVRIWGLSATLANLDEALSVLIGPGRPGRLVRGVAPREVEIGAVLPTPDRPNPWSGHFGVRNAAPVIDAFLAVRTTLVFTNTRAQAEIWYRAIVDLRPDLEPDVALHHGSIDREVRLAIEDRLRAGTIRCVVCTSSLDLGVDFSPVDRVMQVGSPKAVARLLQRAGRSGHRPGAVSRVICVPTNAFELVEITATRTALALGRIEAREPPVKSLDVLCQHLVTVAMGDGFVGQEMLAEVRLTHCFHELDDAEWGWVMDFVTRGGQALAGYPQYHKVVEVAGVYRVMNEQVRQRHRESIGTIAGSTQMDVAFVGGKRLGQIQETFIARLRPGDAFQFAGRRLELVRTKDITAYVRAAKTRTRAVPRWTGTQLPISEELADTVLETLDGWKTGTVASAELDSVSGYLRLQQTRSHLPGPDDFLVERASTREGHSLYCYPFAGRLVHEGLSMLVAHRLSERRPATFTLQVNDYGFELMSPEPIEADERTLREAFRPEDLVDGILGSMNAGELTQRRFRDIARIAGLVFEGGRNRRKSTRQVQASSGLIYQVLVDYDSENLLLEQARREVLEAQLEYRRLDAALVRIASRRWVVRDIERLSPLAFPLWAESTRGQTISTESVQERIDRELGALDAEAADVADDPPRA